jgi:hypothetical protein
MLEGAALASVLNKWTTKTTTTIETIVHVNAGARELMLINDQVTPETLQVRSAPLFARPEAARGDASTSSLALVPDEMKICPMCAEPVRGAVKICRYCRHEFETNLA